MSHDFPYQCAQCGHGELSATSNSGCANCGSQGAIIPNPIKNRGCTAVGDLDSADLTESRIKHAEVEPGLGGARDDGRSDGIHESDGAVLARMGTDGVAWAAEFVRCAREYGVREKLDRGELLDEILDPGPGGFLHGWFANALEAGRAAGYHEASTVIQVVRDALARVSAELG